MAKNEISEERLSELYEKEKRLEKLNQTATKARIRREARIKLTLMKANEAGIKVSEQEVLNFLASKKK